MRITPQILAVSAALLSVLSGCSWVMQGTSQEVEFSSEPDGATFTLNGKTETTPAKIAVPKNDYSLTFQRDGFKDAEVELRRKINPWFYGSIAMGAIASVVDLATGSWKEFDTTKVHVVLDPIPGRVLELPVTVVSTPPGADIVIANRSYGVTPKDLKLSWQPREPEKEVKLRLAGYAEKSVALPRTEKQLVAALEALPVPVTHQITSKPDKAEVRVDGRLMGKTPLPVDLTWKVGDKPRVVEWSLEGYKTEKREILRDLKELTVDLQEAVEELVLPLKIEPAAAKVVVDGVSQPEGTRVVKLLWSLSKTKHTLILSQPGYATRTVEVKRADATRPLEVRLAPALPGNQ